MALTMTIGCGEASDEQATQEEQATQTASSALTTPCRPDAGYDECFSTDLSAVTSWQRTLPNPKWRTVTQSPMPNIDYKVVIDVRELNDGIIPTGSGQGFYDDAEDYIDTYSDLVGVDITQHNVHITVIGSTVKLGNNGGPTNSTGLFFFDALSTENGEILFDHDNVTYDILDTDRIHDFLQDDNSTSAGPIASTANFAQSSLCTDIMNLCVIDEELLIDSPYSADLHMGYRTFHIDGVDSVIPGRISMEISGVSRVEQGVELTCLWRWIPSNNDYLSGELERHCVTADELTAVVELGQPHWAFEEPVTVEDETSVSTIVGFIGQGAPQEGEGCGLGVADFDLINDFGDEETLETPNLDPEDCTVLGPHFQ